MKELKANLDLYGILLKLRECDKIFKEQYEAIVEHAGFDLENIQDEYNDGMYHCMNAVKDLIGESAMNDVFDIIPPSK